MWSWSSWEGKSTGSRGESQALAWGDIHHQTQIKGRTRPKKSQALVTVPHDQLHQYHIHWSLLTSCHWGLLYKHNLLVYFLTPVYLGPKSYTGFCYWTSQDEYCKGASSSAVWAVVEYISTTSQVLLACLLVQVLLLRRTVCSPPQALRALWSFHQLVPWGLGIQASIRPRGSQRVSLLS